MLNDVAALEEKVRRVSSLCQRLREENRGLRERLATLESSQRQLEDKVEAARGRLENLLRTLPE
ncbi:MAG: hypothetical protein IT514_03370 [Burkholderiales bacterium]|nr:hypothetical protein [Burkholderiales bacterium]